MLWGQKKQIPLGYETKIWYFVFAFKKNRKVMHIIKTSAIVAMLFLAASFCQLAQAQSPTPEICWNGIDDDGDGLVDCYDVDCAGDSACLGGFVNLRDTCTIPLAPGPFSLVEEWRTDTALADIFSTMTPIAGDLNGDGFVEVLAYNHNDVETNISTAGPGDSLFIIDGRNGSVLAVCDFSSTGSFAARQNTSGIAIGNLDSDPFSEILVLLDNTSVARFEHTGGSPTWVSPSIAASVGTPLQPILNIADLDGDGNAEFYLGSHVFNGQTGAFIGSPGFMPPGLANGAPLNSGLFLIPYGVGVAADVLPDAFCADCAGMEIVVGFQVFSVNIATGTVAPVVTSLPPAGLAGPIDGFVSLADYDKDGDLDGVVAANRQFGGGNGLFEVAVYAWDLQTPTVLATSPTFVSPFFGNIGQPTIADFDGDGMPEVAVNNENTIRVLDDFVNGLAILWTQSCSDGSGYTSHAAFDFWADGSSELVYSDEDFLRVYDGATGGVLSQSFCRSSTIMEKPIVLDVDNDGQAEVVCACSENPDNPALPPDQRTLARLHGFIAAFGSGGAAFAPARSVWNQANYFVTNVNDDLSLPLQQQGQHLIGDGIVLNGFNLQASRYDTASNVVGSFPDLVLRFLSADSIVCQSGSIYVEISFELSNLGAVAVNGPVPIAFYDQDPLGANASLLGTVSYPGPMPSSFADTLAASFSFPFASQFYGVAGDTGSLSPPVSLPQLGPLECFYLNNFDSLPLICAFNSAPLALDDQASTPEDTPLVIPVQSNDSDPEGDALTTTLLGSPLHGTAVVLNGDSIGYTPDPDYAGCDSFLYVLQDNGAPPLSDTAQVVVCMTPVNDAPEILAGGLPQDTVSLAVAEDGSLSYCVTLADPDLPDDSLLCAVSQGMNGTAILLNDTCILYQPAPNFSGLDTLLKTVCDTAGLCDSLVVLIAVTPANDAPLALDDQASTPEDTPLVIPVQSNDSDPEGDALTTTLLGSPLHGTAVVLNSDSIGYTPDPDYAGCDSFLYVVQDNGAPPLSDTAQVVVCMTPVNDVPVAVDDSLALAKNSGTILTNVLANDNDPDGDPLSLSILIPPSHGTASISGQLAGYAPDSGYVGQDSFVYVVCDASLCDTATVWVEVFFQDTVPPVAVCQDITLYLDSLGMAFLLPSDIDGGSTDDCGVDSLWVDRDSFGLADVGPQVVFLYVLDVGGNLDSCMAEVTVVDSFFVGMEPGFGAGLLVYPNPVGDRLQVRVLDPGLFVEGLAVFDVRGALLWHLELGGDQEAGWATADWASGLYWLRISANGRVFWRKVWVEH